jgi:spore coat protein CotF
LAPKIASCRALDAQAIGNALYGLQSCSSGVAEVRVVLKALAPKIASCNEALSAQAVGNALYGLMSCSSDTPEVRQVLQALAPKIASCNEALSGQAVGNALYGLQSCSSDAPEVRQVLQALAPKIASCNEALSGQAVGNALYGLMSCSSDAPEVRQVLHALAPKIASCAEPLKAQNVGNALYGLMSCSSDAPEVRQVLRALAPKFASCAEAFNAQAVGNALYGLQSCSSDVAEVREIISVLEPFCTTAEPLGVQALGNALFGLQRVSPTVRAPLLSVFLPRVLRVSATPSALSNDDLTHIAHGCVALRCSADYPDEQQLLAVGDACISELSRRTPASSGSRDEALLRSFSRQLLVDFYGTSAGHSCSGPEYLLGFEADIVLRIPSQTASPRIVNIEIDGIHHGIASKRHFYDMRDAFLRSKGVVVERWDLMAHHGASPARKKELYREWFVNVLQRAGSVAGRAVPSDRQ